MNEYFEIVETEERFNLLRETQLSDDHELLGYLRDIDHVGFNFALLNIGTLLQTISIFFELKNNEIESTLSLEKDKIRDRRMKEMVREMNEKINLRYDLPEETCIVKKIYVYNNQSYLLIAKFEFINTLTDNADEINIGQM